MTSVRTAWFLSEKTEVRFLPCLFFSFTTQTLGGKLQKRDVNQTASKMTSPSNLLKLVKISKVRAETFSINKTFTPKKELGEATKEWRTEEINYLYDTPVVHIVRLVSVGIVRAVRLDGHFSAPAPVSVLVR